MLSDRIPTVLILHRMPLRPDRHKSREAASLVQGTGPWCPRGQLGFRPVPLALPTPPHPVSVMVTKYLLYWTKSLSHIARDQGPHGLNKEPVFLKHPLTHLFLERGGTVDGERARSQEEGGGG